MVLFDYVHIDMFRELGCRSVVGQVSSCIYCVTLVELSEFINQLVENQSLCGPVNCGVGFL